MKDVILKSLELTNFKGEAHRLTNFNHVTTISGRNESGKSRHFDAFIWLLFGKDQFDRTNHEIFTTINGKTLEKVDAVVQGVLEVEGRDVHLTRTFRQNWVRKRGSEVETYEGNATIYEIDGVAVKAGEFKAHIDSIIEESVFKLLTNPQYFLNLKWEEQRSILFQIAGTIADVEVLDKLATVDNKDAISNLANIINQGKDLTQFKKEIASKKLVMKKELALIQPRIDQTIKMMPEVVNFEAFEKELQSIDLQIKAIDTEFQDISESEKTLLAENREKQKAINALKVKQNETVLKAEQSSQEGVYKQNAKRRQLVEALTIANEGLAEFSTAEASRMKKFNSLTFEKEALETKLTKMGEQWGEINERVFNEDNSCPYCTQSMPISETAREDFENHRKKELEEINKKGQLTSDELSDVVSKLEEALPSGNKSIILERINDLTTQLELTPHITGDKVKSEELPEWQSLQAEIKIIEDSIDNTKRDTSDLDTKKQALIEERDEVKLVLNDKALIHKAEEEISNLNNQAKTLAKEIALLEKQEFQIQSFTRIKIQESESRINTLFSLVNFKLFDYTFEGNEFEVCIPTNKEGVPISTVNSAQKINSGLDVINVLCKFHNVTAPIFVDNREGVDDLIETQSQIINLVVVKGQDLIVE